MSHRSAKSCAIYGGSPNYVITTEDAVYVAFEI